MGVLDREGRVEGEVLLVVGVGEKRVLRVGVGVGKADRVG